MRRISLFLFLCRPCAKRRNTQLSLELFGKISGFFEFCFCPRDAGSEKEAKDWNSTEAKKGNFVCVYRRTFFANCIPSLASRKCDQRKKSFRRVWPPGGERKKSSHFPKVVFPNTFGGNKKPSNLSRKTMQHACLVKRNTRKCFLREVGVSCCL